VGRSFRATVFFHTVVCDGENSNKRDKNQNFKNDDGLLEAKIHSMYLVLSIEIFKGFKNCKYQRIKNQGIKE